VANCLNARNGVGTANNLNNDAYTSVDVDVDADGTTFNSSSATLTLAVGDSVMFAGLYWGAYSADAARNTVRFRTPTAGYATITATQLDQDATTSQNYQGFRDVTALVRAGGSGNYFVANVQRELATARYAGWTLVVVLYNQASLPRSLAVYDGYARVFTGVPVSIAVSGLNTPPAGAVNTQLGIVGYEGDLGIVGDVLQLNATTISDAQNPASNPFNSSLSALGVRFSAKNPDYVNQLAFDADILDASNILPNGATTATISLTSTGDQYYPGVVTFASQLYSPTLSGPGSLEKTVVDVNGGSVLPGDTLAYTINMTNTGLDTALSIVLVDTIPTGAGYAAGSLTFVSSVAGGPPAGTKTDAAGDDAANFDAAGNRVLFRIGAGATAAAGGKLGPSQSSVIRFRVVISPAATAGTVISNQARVSYVGQSLGTNLNGVSDGDPGTAGTQPTLVTVTAPDLSIAKSHAGNFTAGVAATYTLTVTNSGTAATIGTLTLIDSVPAGLTPTGASGSGWTCGIVAQVVTCTNPGPLAVSGTSTVTVNVSVLAAAVPSVTNVARVSTPSDGNAANDRATDPTTVGAGADLSVTKTDGTTSVNPGGTLTYTIVATNAGPSNVAGATVTDTYNPAVFNVAGVTWTCAASAGSSCPASGSGNLNASVNLLSSGIATFTVTAPVLSSASGTITNTASVAAPAGTTDFAAGNNSGTDNDTAITPGADLGVTQADAPDPVNAGATITYTLTATNNGPLTAQDVTIQDNTPAGTTFLSATPSTGGSCTTPAVGGTGLASCTWTGSTVVGAPGVRTVTLVMTVGAATAGGTSVSNTASVSSLTLDPIAGNNSASTTTTVAVSADIGITKTGPVSVVPGTTLVYTITVTNAGPSDATGVSAADVTPSDLTFVSNAGACATAFPCSLGSIPAGGSLVITTSYAVPAGYAGANPIVNAATASATSTDPVGANNTATASTPVAAGSADLALSNTGPASVTPGQTVAFTITVTNNGPSDAAGVSVADATPAGLSFLSNAGACVSAFPCSLGTIAAGTSRTITATYQVPSGYAGANPIVNTATVSAATADPAGANDTQAASVPVNAPSADLAIANTGPATVTPGQPVVYTIVVTNNGPSDAASVAVADPTPTGLTFVSNAGACAAAFPCALGTVAAGATQTITATYQVPAAYAGPNPIVNSATVSSSTGDPVAGNGTATASTAVGSPSADLAITKTGPASVVPGTALVYTITVTNTGPSDATGVSVADVTPGGVTFVSNGGACATAFPCSLGTIAAGASQIITTTYDVPSGYAGANPIVNAATVSASSGDPVAANNTGTTSTPVAGTADLSLTNTGPASVTPGQTLAFTITVTNNGPSDAAGVSVADATPAGLTFLSNAGACVSAFPCNLGTVTAGAARTITATYLVPSGYAGANPIANAATVTTATTDPNGTNDSQTANVTVDPASADLAVTKSGPASAVPGQSVVYTIVVTNNGPSDAAAVSVADNTPSGLTFTSNSGACTTGFPCALGSVVAGATRTITATYQVPAGYAGPDPIVNTAILSSPTADPVPGNGSATASTTLAPPSADLAITKTGPANVVPGTDLVYTITVTNAGPSDAAGVSVADITPSGLTFVSNAGACATAFPCSLGVVAAGATSVITATFAVPAGYAGANPVVNVATVSATSADPVAANNSATTSTPVAAGSADLSLTNTGPAAGTPGQTLTFTITVTNNGPSDAAGVSVSDATPAGLTFLSTAGSCVTAFPCALGTIPAGATRTISATYRVSSSYSGANPILNTASVTSVTADPAAGNEAQTAPVTVNPAAADLAIGNAGPATVIPGQTVIYTISVTNNGPSDAASVAVADPTPTGLTFVSNSGACSVAFPCSLGTLGAGATQTITATYLVASGYAGPNPIISTATVSSPTGDPVAGNESATASTTLAPAAADLGITLAGPASVVPGTSLVYTITVTNTGPSDAAGVSVADVTPAGLTFAANTGACVTAFPCGLGTIAAGASQVITTTFSVPSGYAGANPIVDAATVSAATGDPVPGNNTASISTPLAAGAADLSLTNTAPASVTPGQTMAFTIVVTNNGPSDAAGVVVSDATPAGLVFVANSGACASPFPCTLGTVSAGSSRTITATYQVPPGYSGANPILNTASVTSVTSDPNPGNEGQTALVAVDPASADMALALSGPAAVVPGQSVVYTITVTNDGPSDAASVAVADPTPAGLVFVSTGGDCTGAFPCALGSVPAGAIRTITATYQVPSGYSGPNPIVNTATVSSPTEDPASGNEAATITTTVNPAQADLSITKAGPASVIPGTDLVYTITVTNTGPSDASGVSVADVTPAGLTFVANAGACAGAFPCLLGTVAAGTSQVITATFAVSAGYAGPNPIVNAATISAATADPVAANNTGTSSTPVTAGSADLSVTLAGPATVTPGSVLTFTTTVSNAGPSDAVGVILADVTPAGLTFVSNAGACTTPFPCALGTIPAGGTRTITVTYQVPSGYSGANPIVVTASVTSITSDPGPGNEAQTASVSVNPPAADLGIAMTGPPNVTPGQTVVYTITVTNNGQSDAASVAVADATPAGLVFLSNAGGCTSAFPCSLGSIPAGATQTVTVTYRVPSGYSGPSPIVNTASVASPTGDPLAGNESATTSTTVNSPVADLQITKSGPASVIPGGTLVYTITVTNTGPSDATGVSVDDPTPAGLTFDSNAGACATAFPCSLGTIAAGASAVITAAYTVPPGYAGANPIVNTATVGGATGDPVPGNNSATTTTPVAAGTADVALTMTAPASVTPGQPLTFTITVTNNGPSDAAGLSVADPTPAGLVFTGTAGACATSFPCALGTVPAGQSRVITATFQVPSSYSGANPILNTASVSAVTSDPVPGNEAQTVSVAVDPASADLSITKSGTANVTPGQNAVYTIVVSNAGPSDAANVTVADPTPAGMVFVSTSGACTTAFPCALGSVPAGATRTITATYHLPSGYSGPSPIVNTATVSSPTGDPVPGNGSATASTIVDPPSADLSVTKTGPVGVAPGTDVTYTITVMNSGPSDAQGVTLTDPTPAGLTFVSATAPCAAGFPCTAGTLAAGASLSLTVTYAVPAGYAGANPIANTASVSATTADPAAANNSATATTPVVSGTADLALTLTGPASVVPGTNLVLTIVVTNNGPSDAAGVSVADATPAGLTFVSTAGACTTALPCALGTVPSGQSRTITATYLVPSGYASPNPVVATASVSAVTADPAAGNNAGTATVALAAGSADLQVTKVGPASATPGQPVVYTITVTNAGPSDAGAASVADPTPAGLVFVSNAGDCTTAFPCTLGPLPAGQVRTITATYLVPAAYTGANPIVNSATAASPTGDPAGGNNASSAAAAVAASADLAITKTGPVSVTPGQTVTYTIQVTNNGPSDATGVAVDDPTPAGLTFVSLAGACTTPFPCALGTMSVGTTRTLTATYQVPAGATGPNPLANTATVTAATPDPSAANNSATASTTLGAPSADLAVTQSGPASVLAGTNLTYTITVTNTGPSDALNVSLADLTPAGLTFVSATAPCAGGFPCTLGTIAAGATVNLTVTDQVPASYTAPDPIVNVVTVTSPTADPNGADNSASTATPLAAPSADLSLTQTGPASVVPGTTIAYTITVANAGPTDAADVAIADPTPAGLTFVAASAPCAAGFPCTLGALATGANVALSVTFAVPAAYAGPSPIVNTATVSATTADPVAANNVQSVSTTVTPVADLAITNSDGLTNVTPGSPVTYTVVVTNAGPSAVSGAAVTDVVPSQLSGVTWTCSAAGGSSCAAGAGAGNVATTVDLAPAGTATFSVSGTVGSTSGAMTNTATVAAPAGTTDPVSGNNSATDVTTIDAVDFQVVKSHTGTFTVASTGAYTITVTNVGTVASTGALDVVDSLPAGLAYSSASGAGWTCAAAGPVVTCSNPGPLAPSAASSIALTVDVQPGAAANVTNVARITTIGDVNAANDRATDLTAITAVDVSLVKRHTGAFTVNQNGDYTLTVKNVGTAPTVGGITLTDTLPAGLGFVSGTGAGWTCAAAGQIVTCTSAGPVAAGDSSIVTLTVSVGFAALPQVTNSAGVTTPGDTALGDNTSTDAPTIVVATASLAAEKEASRTEVEIGDQLDYTVRVRNTGVSPAPDVTVTDQLPMGFAYVPGSARRNGLPLNDPAGGAGPQLVFALDTLAPATVTTLTYRVRVGPGAGLGDGINRAVARSPLGSAQSNLAAARVQLVGGVFTDEGLIVGKVMLDGDSLGLGIPGVRLYLEDGTSTVSDVEGKYSFYGVTPRLHVVKVDATTLPPAARLTLITTRQAGDAATLFVDVQRGEMHRADFAVASTPEVLAAVQARRDAGEITGPIPGDGRRDTVSAPLGARPAELASGGAFAPPAPEAGRDTLADVFTSVLPARTLTNDNSNAPALPAADIVPTLAIGRQGVISVQVPLTGIPADGGTLVPVAIRLLDAQGAPLGDRTVVTLEASAGRWQVPDDDPTAPGVQTTVTDGARLVYLVATAQAGQAQVRVSTSVLSGSATLVFVPARRALLAAGVAEGRIDLRSWSLPAFRIRDRFEDELRNLSVHNAGDKLQAGTRAAVFVKGTVGPQFVIDFRLDTERDPRARLFRDIQPDEFYPVYGDASIKDFDAQSTGRLYLRVEKARSYFLVGDYGTTPANEVRMLGAYSRSLNGALQHVESRWAAANLFASRGHESQVIDEFPGRGISGPFVLSQKSGLANSERVEIVTRDRNQPAVILKREVLTRFTDYTIEPFSGRLVLKAPVPSVDQNFNPISVLVTYEVDQGGTPFWVFGGDAQVRAGGSVELGGSAVRDDNPLGARSLVSGNTTIRLGARTYAVGEVAHADSAGAISGNAFRFELRTFADRWEARLYGLDAAADFANPSSALGRGRRELGARGSAILNRRTRLLLDALRSEDLVTTGRRIGFQLGIEREVSERLRLELGARHAEETTAPASGATAGTTPSETNSLSLRLTGQLTPRAAVFGEFEQALAAGDRRRALIGGDYRFAGRARIYGRHEFISSLAGPYALNGSQQQNTTVIGLDADYLANASVFSEYRARDAFNGREAEAAIGLRNRWTLAPGLRLNTSFERVSPLAGSGTGAATALTGALDYSENPLWKGSARVEYRTAPSGDNWLTSLGYGRKLSRDWTLLGRSVLSALAHDELHEHSEIGFAFRQTTANRWSLLARYEHRYDRTDLASGSTRDAAHVFSSHLNFQPTRVWTVTGEVSGKVASQWAAGLTSRTNAELVGVRGVRDLGAGWDVGASARALVTLGQSRAQYGVGLELGHTLATNLRVAAGYNLFGFHDRDLAGQNYSDHGLYLRFGFKFDESLFGSSRAPLAAAPPDSTRDSDADGVPDVRDACPATPSGATVDERGCPGDGDQDGVLDGFDKCPDTVAGALVDGAGCQIDSDTDGVADGLDQCPATPAGAMVNRMGCPSDTDVDGVLDGIDQCPDTPTGAVVDVRGCPADSDIDGVPDVVDRCPGTPPGTPVDRSGCIVLFQVNSRPGARPAVILRGVTFETGKSVLKAESFSVLDQVAASLVANPDIRIEVAGYSDNTGSAAINTRLSRARAIAVRAYLATHGVAPDRMTARGFGPATPVATNQTAAGRAQNRRVELHRLP
jgi:uncharacterized repeat protein (TIGR01451 family)